MQKFCSFAQKYCFLDGVQICDCYCVAVLKIANNAIECIPVCVLFCVVYNILIDAFNGLPTLQQMHVLLTQNQGALCVNVLVMSIFVPVSMIFLISLHSLTGLYLLKSASS